MSKYSRTRKAICRISHLKEWIVTRTYFNVHKNQKQTWKQSYKKYKKEIIKCYGYNRYNLPRYCDYIKNNCVWNLPI